MKYKFSNNEQTIEQDILWWLSLLELGKENGLHTQGDYTPSWALRNRKQKPNNSNPYQVVTNKDVQELAKSFEQILSKIPPDVDNKGMEREQLFRHEIAEDGDNIFCMPVFLGLSKGIADFSSCLCSLEYFYGENSKKLRDLILFLQVGEFTIDWTPIDETNSKEQITK